MKEPEPRDEDLAWLTEHLPPAPAAHDPLTRRTVAGALERARHRPAPGRPWWLLALAGAAVAVLLLGRAETTPPLEAVVLVPAETEEAWEDADVAQELEVVLPDPPGFLDPDEDELTDEEMAAVTWQLVLPSRS